MFCFLCFLCREGRIGLGCQFLYDLLLRFDRACQSTFRSLDIKTFDNQASPDAEEGEEAACYTVPTNYAA